MVSQNKAALWFFSNSYIRIWVQSKPMFYFIVHDQILIPILDMKNIPFI